MREIKFRAWNSRTKWMHDWLDLCCLPHTLKFFDEPKPYILMQYTGLKDKNGIEIYEGDIVKGQSSRKYGCVFDYLGMVKWCNQSELIGYYVYDKDGLGWELKQIADRISCDHITGEIIGNIFENKDQYPELLEMWESLI